MHEKLGAYLKANYGCKAFFDGADYIVHPETPLPEGVEIKLEDVEAFVLPIPARPGHLAALETAKDALDKASTVAGVRAAAAAAIAALEARLAALEGR